jgi:hypothetical protein
LSGQRPLTYYLCAGDDATADPRKSPIKVNWTALVLIIFTFVAPLVLKVRVRIRERSWHGSHPHAGGSPIFLDSQNISDILSDLINMTVFGSACLMSLAVNRMTFSDVLKHQESIL